MTITTPCAGRCGNDSKAARKAQANPRDQLRRKRMVFVVCDRRLLAEGEIKMTPTERRALHSPAVVEAWEWIDTYCPHYATQGRDWQTTDNMSAASRVMARRHLATLRDAGLIEIESAPPRGNFVKKPL